MDKYRVYTEKHRDLILNAFDYIWKNPETGYREWKTHAYLEEAFAKLGYELTLAGDIPGFTAEVDTGRPGPTVAIFGEMDSLLCKTHPEADPQTGAAHVCGHCCQAAALLGLAAVLQEPGALDGLCGKIRLIAVPAEELIEMEYREQLRQQGTIRYFGGKIEFMYRGLLDGVDMAAMIHAISRVGANEGYVDGGSNGLIAKTVTYKGVSAHAGGAPHKGVNALYAANLGLNAINALRETFQDNAHIRVHPIITNGGDAVNAVPDTVRIESYIRGADMQQVAQVNRKVNRALAATAAAMGGNVHLHDVPGYWPRKYDKTFVQVAVEAMEQVLDKVTYAPQNWGGGSSDMGDVGAVIPAIHPYIGGASGTSHGSEFYITDPNSACVKATHVFAVLLEKLLKNDAAKAKEILDGFTPEFASTQDYLSFLDKLNLDCDAVSYDGENKAVLSYGEA